MDSDSVSSKIRELFDLNRSGILSNEEYLSQLKTWIISQMKRRPLNEIKEGIKPTGNSEREIRPSARKSRQEIDLLKSDLIKNDDDQPVKEKVEKILWTHLN